MKVAKRILSWWNEREVEFSMIEAPITVYFILVLKRLQGHGDGSVQGGNNIGDQPCE